MYWGELLRQPEFTSMNQTPRLPSSPTYDTTRIHLKPVRWTHLDSYRIRRYRIGCGLISCLIYAFNVSLDSKCTLRSHGVFSETKKIACSQFSENEVSPLMSWQIPSLVLLRPPPLGSKFSSVRLPRMLFLSVWIEASRNPSLISLQMVWLQRDECDHEQAVPLTGSDAVRPHQCSWASEPQTGGCWEKQDAQVSPAGAPAPVSMFCHLLKHLKWN